MSGINSTGSNLPRGVAIFRTLLFGFEEINEESKTILTRLANVNIYHASLIVDVLEYRLQNAHPEMLLPLLFVVDSILKKVGGEYVNLFSKRMIKWLVIIFPLLSDEDKLKMMVLRSTWKGVLSPTVLYYLDARLNAIDAEWSVTSGCSGSLLETPNGNEQMEFLENEKMRVEKELEETERLLWKVESTNSPSFVRREPRLRGSFSKGSSASSENPSVLSETAALPEDVPLSKYARLPSHEAVKSVSPFGLRDKIVSKIPRTTMDSDDGSFRNRFSTAIEIQPPNPVELSEIEVPITHVMIDGKQKKIRFYWGTSVALEEDPIELKFVNCARTVLIDDHHYELLHMNKPAITISVGNLTCDIRLGSPSRELCINERFYTAVFDGPPTYVRVGDNIHKFVLLGPPPKITRGPTRRDLVAGWVYIIINGKDAWPIYLDSKPQRFDVNGVPFILQFINRLQGLLVNGIPIELDMDTTPVEVSFGGIRHYLTFSPLPKHVIPGKVYLHRMPSGIKCVRQISTPLAKLLFSRSPCTPFAADPIPSRNWIQTSSRTTTPVKDTNLVDVRELYKKLQDAGLVPQSPSVADPSSQSLVSVSFDDDMTTLRKTRQPGLINRLYSGVQCSHCTLRFSASDTQEYTDHLKLHTKEMDCPNQGSCRSFMKVSDWKTFKIEQTSTCTDENQNEHSKKHLQPGN